MVLQYTRWVNNDSGQQSLYISVLVFVTCWTPYSILTVCLLIKDGYVNKTVYYWYYNNNFCYWQEILCFVNI